MNNNSNNRFSTGVDGLDEVLMGGLLPGHTYLLRGGPGTGKTTLGLQFLAAGVSQGEKALYITLEESEASLRKNASRLGLNVEGVEFLDLSPDPEYFSKVESYDIFSPAEVERSPATSAITEAVERIKPARVFIDPLTQFRYLSTDVFQFRKQVLSFLRFLSQQGATVLFSSESSPSLPDEDLQFMADGIIKLDLDEYGRTLTVQKHRGSDFVAGSHCVRLDIGGITVYPKLVPAAYGLKFSPLILSSGLPELDKMLCGGLEHGTVTFISGPSGVGKSTLGMQFIQQAASQGERSVLFSFDEEVGILMRRCESVGIKASEMVEKGMLKLEKIGPLRFTPDEFARWVRREVEEQQTRVVMLDSVSGYRLSMRGRDLVAQLHALTKYLQNMGVVVLLAVEIAHLTGDFRVTDYDISYLADNIVFLRYLEIDGQMKKAIGVLKKRLSDFEKTLREFETTQNGIQIGHPLVNLRGILTGTPSWVHNQPNP